MPDRTGSWFPWLSKHPCALLVALAILLSLPAFLLSACADRPEIASEPTTVAVVAVLPTVDPEP
ncbi:MAG: hypothetical protein OXG11_12870, partial [Chloroflexi bacterium]|nr:hypothetical protein [Chloroflexota bacterium]